MKLRSLVCLFVATLLGSSTTHAIVQLEDLHPRVGSRDLRVGSLAPLSAATALVQSHPQWRANWNRYGTVHTLQQPGGFLAEGLSGNPETAARTWLKAHRSLFRLSEAGIDALKLLRDTPLNQTDEAHVLLFRQTQDGVPVAFDGRIKIGLTGGKLFWVASSSIGDIGALPAVQLTPAQAWTIAAGAVPLETPIPTLVPLADQGGWKLFQATGFTGPQRVRAGIIGLPGANAVPAFEANVVQFAPSGRSIAYTAYVAADDGRVLLVHDRVDQAGAGATRTKADRTESFSGSYPPGQTGTCGPCHGPYLVSSEDNFARVVAAVSSASPANDIMVDIYYNDATCAQSSALVGHADSGTSPEVAVYAPPSGVVPVGSYYVEACPYAAGVALTEYNGSVLFNEGSAPTPTSPNAKWQHFNVTPAYDHASVDDRPTSCWFLTGQDGSLDPACQDEFVEGSSHRIPWDYIGNAPSQTTSGNNARSYEGWNAAIGGGSPYQPPARSQRDYLYPWANTWFVNACNPAVISHATPESNDIDAAVTNLFVLHNRLHDFAYQLGLRERNGVAQTSNYGQTDVNREADAENGFAQAGAISGGFPSYLGRDNANQATLQDGVAPLSNMYLWQSIGGAAYAPCVDGDFDGQIVAHEYGHLVQHRMTDPDQGLSGQQGRSMGEGWADLNSVMIFDEFNLVPDGAPDKFSIGAYVSNDLEKGIRNYPISNSPLMFSDIGYDNACEIPITNTEGTCEAQGEVHSDAEPWTAILFRIRQSLIAKFDALGYASTDIALRRLCAEGVVPADRCAGQRRWSQLIHDGMILQPPAPTFVDARNAILAADVARNAQPGRFWPSNQAELWTAFARGGLGASASTTGSADTDPVGGWDSPLGGNAQVTFVLLDPESNPVVGEVFVGRHEARSTPAADTDPASALSNAIAMVPGDYDFFVRADGYGHARIATTIAAAARTLRIQLAPNFASASAGAVASGAGELPEKLLDETEATAWQSLSNSPSVTVAHPTVTVALAGGSHDITRVQVSGVLQNVVGEAGQNRFSSIHQFALAACDAASANCSQDASYTQIYESPDGAFPSAGFRPIVSDMLLREFRLPQPTRASHLRFIALHNKCTGTPAYQGYLGVPGQEDQDAANSADCRVGNGPKLPPRTTDVRAAELQVFGADALLLPEGGTIFRDGYED